MDSSDKAIKATYFSILSNTVLALLKGIAGVFGNSFALIADAIESTTDVVSSFLVLIGLRFSTKPPDKDHPYGHGKAEALITFLIVGFLITSALVIAIQAIDNIRTVQAAPQPWTLYVLTVVILWKEASFRYVLKKSNETQSSVLKADAWHHRSDAITSVAAFLGITISLIGGDGYETADDWAALFASALILYNSYQIFRPALGEIMDENLYEDFVREIKQASLKVIGIIEVRKCTIRKTGMRYHVDIHATVDGTISVKHGHTLAHELEDALRKKFENLEKILIHIEPA
jgi:cation diffusion facilitator family transporter